MHYINASFIHIMKYYLFYLNSPVSHSKCSNVFCCVNIDNKSVFRGLLIDVVMVILCILDIIYNVYVFSRLMSELVCFNFLFYD